MTFEIYNGANSIDLTNNVVGDINVQVRRDYAFAEGGLNLFVDDTANAILKKNIPPFTFCKLNGKHYLCSSICRAYQPQSIVNNVPVKSYYHEVKLLDVLAILECFVLGCKTESNYTDIDSLNQIIALINNKYSGFVISLDSSVASLLSASHDYTFHAGTTLYDVLKEYAERNKVRFIVSNTSIATSRNITLKALENNIDYYEEVEGVGVLDPINPLSYSLEQNVDNYSKHLETIQNNVVDRNNSNRWIDMTCRVNNFNMTADSAEILLPTSVESISEFVVNGNFKYKFDFANMNDIFDANFWLAHGQAHAGGFYIYVSFNDLIGYNISYDGHSNVFQWLFDTYFTPFFTTIDMTNKFYIYYNTSTSEITTDMSTVMARKDNYYYDYIDYLLEETEASSLDVRNKPKYAVYKTGDNRIYNLNATYQKSFLNDILHISVGNFLQEDSIYSNVYIDDNNYIILQATATDYDPTHHSYTISGVPMVDNLIVRDTKNYTPYNEANWKNLTRTYQNSANPVEFDSLIKDMKQQNIVLGSNELSYEIPMSTIMDNKNYIIKDSDNLYWYVNSMIYTFKANYGSVMINCSKMPLKIADVIGVDYQYNPMKLATQNVVVRPLYYELKHTNTYNAVKSNYLNGLDTFLLVISSNGNTPIHQVAVRTTIFVDADENYYLYASMLDNYSAGKQSINVQASNYEIRDIPYCDDNYRFENIAISLVCMQQSLPQSFSEKMPNITATDLLDVSCDVYSITDEDTIYKDERETLAFTIKLVKP